MDETVSKKDLEDLKKALLEVVAKIEKIERGSTEREIGMIIARKGAVLENVGVVKRVGRKIVFIINTENGEIREEYDKLPNRAQLEALLKTKQESGALKDVTGLYYSLT